MNTDFDMSKVEDNRYIDLYRFLLYFKLFKDVVEKQCEYINLYFSSDQKARSAKVRAIRDLYYPYVRLDNKLDLFIKFLDNGLTKICNRTTSLGLYGVVYDNYVPVEHWLDNILKFLKYCEEILNKSLNTFDFVNNKVPFSNKSIDKFIGDIIKNSTDRYQVNFTTLEELPLFKAYPTNINLETMTESLNQNNYKFFLSSYRETGLPINP
jgi:hypothetical protein